MTPATMARPNVRPTGAGMRLAEFVLHNREPILAEWEAFARTCAIERHDGHHGAP